MAATVTPALNQDIIDIRRDKTQYSLLGEVTEALQREDGLEKEVSTMLLYDEKGLKLFEDITYLDEYYPTNTEIEVLSTYSKNIIERISDGALVVELGSGNLRKVNILLKELEAQKKNIDYYALDLSYPELVRSLSMIPTTEYKHVKCRALHGTYDDGLVWLTRPEFENRQVCILWLGSSIGNLSRKDGSSFLKEISGTLKPDDLLLVGLDGCQDGQKVHTAYNDSKGVTHSFYRNGLEGVNKITGLPVFDLEKWTIIGYYNGNEGRHEAFAYPHEDIAVGDFKFRKSEHVRLENSHKFSASHRARLLEEGTLQLAASYPDQTGSYFLNIFKPSVFQFSSRPAKYARHPVPRLEDFQKLWSAWDTITQQMLPQEENEESSSLRSYFLFYLAHVSVFLDTQLSKASGQPISEPASFHEIFGRGLDADTGNPAFCYGDGKIPKQLPPLPQLLAFQQLVRARTSEIYAKQEEASAQEVAKALWSGFEHEAMHLEAVLSLLVQLESPIPPPGVTPDFESFAKSTERNSKPNNWFNIPAKTISLGTEGSTSKGSEPALVWENEKPLRKAEVPAFKAQGRAITNGDYAKYLSQNGIKGCPASWGVGPDQDSNSSESSKSTPRTDSSEAQSDLEDFLHGKEVKTVYGPVSLKDALDWPVMASFDELEGYAKWMGGRIPTMEEVHSLYAYAEELSEDLQNNTSIRTIPARSEHLVKGDRETSLKRQRVNSVSEKNGSVPFVDLSECNVGFKSFHPVPVAQDGDKLAGHAGMGGVWEWTSSKVRRHDGQTGSPELYPSDAHNIFDGKHNIVLGGSWATHPRIAGRKSFVNWSKRNNPHAWCGARLVKDV